MHKVDFKKRIVFDMHIASIFLSAMSLDGVALQDEGQQQRHLVGRYAKNPSDVIGIDETITLKACIPPKPLYVSEKAELHYRGLAQLSVMDSTDHELHYIVGKTTVSMHDAVKAYFTNILLCALEIVYLEKRKKEWPKLKRRLVPVMFNRKANKLQLQDPLNEELEYCFFLSYGKARRPRADHQSVVALSADKPYMVEFRGKELKTYFQPSLEERESCLQEKAKQLFPEVQGPYHSEQNAVYALIQTPQLVTELLGQLPMHFEALAYGVRYFSFLDMCLNCQTFLETHQTDLKPNFIEALQTIYEQKGRTYLFDIPFLSVAHGNRIFRDPKQQYHSSGQAQEKVHRDHYPYATSGPEQGNFVLEFKRYAGTITLERKDSAQNKCNRLLQIMHEPDLGEDDSLGEIRQYFHKASSIDFSRQAMGDEHVHSLTSKAERSNPGAITTFNLSENKMGREEPEFYDDPIPLTDGKKLMRTIRLIGSYSNLQVLNLSGNILGTVVTQLKSSLSNLKKLRELYIANVGFSVYTSNEMSYFLTSLEGLENLMVLDLSDNQFRFEGTKAFLKVLPGLTKLQKLSIRNIDPLPAWDRVSDPSYPVFKSDSSAFLGIAEHLNQRPNVRIEIGKKGFSQSVRKNFIDVLGRSVDSGN